MPPSRRCPGLATTALWLAGFAACASAPDRNPEAARPQGLLFEDNFARLHPGAFSQVIGARAEYHYIPEVSPREGWTISAFGGVSSQRAWRVLVEGDRHVMAQTMRHRHPTWRPLLAAGDPLWRDYTLTVRFARDAGEAPRGFSGVAFRYQNDRSHYQFGIDGERVVLRRLRHAHSYGHPDLVVLAEAPLPEALNTTTDYLQAIITARGDQLQAQLASGPSLSARDDSFATGRIALMADDPTRFAEVVVTADAAAAAVFRKARADWDGVEAGLQRENPKLKLWRKFATADFGVGRNLRFGDLDGDGQLDILFGQVVQHGPRDANAELSCLTAVTLDGRRLWQVGAPDLWKTVLTNDVAFQIHDLDGDGKNEVIYTQGFELIVADGQTGKSLRRTRLPDNPSREGPHGRFPQILGDSLFIFDARGTGHPRDLLIKDRYGHVWVYDDKLRPLWQAAANTGHYPYATDIDDDGRQEVMVGYTLFDDNGKPLWSLADKLKEHADGVAILPLGARPGDDTPTVLIAASGDGMVFADLSGRVLKHHHIGHAQNVSVANYRDDLPGLELVSINYWENQGIVNIYGADGNIVHEFEPAQHGSMLLPVNWAGGSEELFLLSPDVDEGGLYDGWGRRAVRFPGDGHPSLASAVLDLTGDPRDEIVVWDEHELWIYTQDDNPREGRLYAPRRNGHFTESNYRINVSRPAFRE